MASTPSAPRKFNRLAGTRIIIFGGTSGIGLSVAQGAVEEGASVFVVSSSGEKVKRAVAQLSDPAQTHSGTPSRVFGALLDLNQGATLESSLRAMFAQLPTVWGGRVEHIVHTAGRFPAKHTLVTQVSYDELHSIADARLVSALLIAKVASKHWTRGGSYTLTGGAFHTRPPPGGIGSCFVGALETAARSISVDFAKVGLHVRANVVTPGFVMTPLANSMPTPLVSALSQATLLPPGQTTTPDMVAQTYLGIMKDDSLIGQTIRSEAGWLLK